MSRVFALALAGALLLCGCPPTRTLSLTFGETGTGLEGFMCRDNQSQLLLSRADPNAETNGYLVFDFIRLGGLPGCRSGQLLDWCSNPEHRCTPMDGQRRCVPFHFPSVSSTSTRKELKRALLDAITQAKPQSVSADAPDEFVIVRMVGTTQDCPAELEATDGNGQLPEYRSDALIGCAYSCPVLLDALEGDIYMDFATLTDFCEQGVRTCASRSLDWQPL